MRSRFADKIKLPLSNIAIVDESTIAQIAAEIPAASWGNIGGTLSAQTDLNSALNGKEPVKGSNDNYVTDAEKIVLSNTSDTNTGDDAVNPNYSGLATSKQDVLISGTNIKTINSTSLLGAGDIAISGSGLTQAQILTRQL